MTTGEPGSTTGPTVWLLKIGHRHGEDTSVHSSDDSALQDLAGFVTQYWNEVAGRTYLVDDEECTVPVEMPDDPAEAVRIYFAAHPGGEWFTLDETVVT
ncbi:hypothetical protein [Mycolicibacterium sp.]|uniref:hypothetical protein n=1 Tax=Mycolicibacterium sp. TaxID=2320850 RepID=UPI0037C6EB79